MSKPTLKRLQRIEQGMLTLLQLNHLFSERADELEKELEQLKSQYQKRSGSDDLRPERPA